MEVEEPVEGPRESFFLFFLVSLLPECGRVGGDRGEREGAQRSDGVGGVTVLGTVSL